MELVNAAREETWSGAVVIEGGEAVARQIGAQGVDVDGPEVVLVVGGREDVRSSSTSTESSARNGRSRGTVAGRTRGRRRGERRRTRGGARVAASCTATSARWHRRRQEGEPSVVLRSPPPVDGVGERKGDAVAWSVVRPWFRSRRRGGARAVDGWRLDAVLRRWM